MKKSLNSLAAISLMLCLATLAPADLKVRIKNSQGSRSYESVSYFKGLRQRKEFLGARENGTPGSSAVIYLCDLKQYVFLNHADRTYWTQRYQHPDEWLAEAEARMRKEKPAEAAARQSRSKGALTETFNIIDTGERKQMFGYTARRIKTVTTWESSPKKCKHKLIRETDGWYVDLLYATECSSDISGSQITDLLAVEETTACHDFFIKNRYSFEHKRVGTARFGFPVMLTIKTYQDDGRALIRTQEVLDITTGELDQALFEVPAGYAEFTPKPYKRSLLDRALSIFGRQ